MTALSIKIQTWDEGQKQVNGLDFKKDVPFKLASIVQACIMERGMTNGKTSVGFRIVDEDGNEYFAELSGALVEGLNSALQGANARFGV